MALNTSISATLQPKFPIWQLGPSLDAIIVNSLNPGVFYLASTYFVFNKFLVVVDSKESLELGLNVRRSEIKKES